ncbi:MAG TPA: sulfatase [Armatimonadota bacterium]|nr:sulfatase [Armatimonadota bacterium]
MARKQNLILFGVDSLRADRMSCYGYPRQTTPHIDRFAQSGVLFERNYSPHIPTTSAYAGMLTGRDCFGTQVVALRHEGPLRPEVPTLAELLRGAGYTTTCVGFGGNPSSRGFDKYIEYPGWGSWEAGPSPKAGKLNEVAIPELDRLAATGESFFLFLRHMDPHSPYLPPPPFQRMFYSGNECDPENHSMDPVMEFKPFCDYFATWMPPGITDTQYVNAQYDGALAYMDACIQQILTRVTELGLDEETLVVLNGDHGETLDEHECYYDHHGLYDPTLYVPLVMRHPDLLPSGVRVPGYSLHQDLVPTLLQLLDVPTTTEFEGKSLLPMLYGETFSLHSEFYITESTWMRKHGWRTPEWKLIVALEPDFHFKPAVELYNLVKDPLENHNVADEEPALVAALRARMDAWIEKREAETGVPNPMFTNLNWHGKAKGHEGPFTSSQQAYDSMYIGSPGAAQKLQARGAARPEEEAV